MEVVFYRFLKNKIRPDKKLASIVISNFMYSMTGGRNTTGNDALNNERGWVYMLAGKKKGCIWREEENKGMKLEGRMEQSNKVFLIQVVVNVNFLKITSHFLNITLSFFEIKIVSQINPQQISKI